jgi:hypothetical protein
MPVANRDDILLVPTDQGSKVVEIMWAQNMANRRASYVVLMAKNQTQGTTCLRPLALATESLMTFYAQAVLRSLSSSMRNGTTAATLALKTMVRSASRLLWRTREADRYPPGPGVYEAKLDSHFQYGQKNPDGQFRFVVFHDKSRHPYQASSHGLFAVSPLT